MTDTLFGAESNRIIMFSTLTGKTSEEIRQTLIEQGFADQSVESINQTIQRVGAEFEQWNTKGLDPIYPIIIIQKSSPITVASSTTKRERGIYTAIGINFEGRRELLAVTIDASYQGFFAMLKQLTQRGVQDVLMCFVDSKMINQALNLRKHFPESRLHLSPAHLILDSALQINRRHEKACSAAVQAIVDAETERAAVAAYKKFQNEWAKLYPVLNHRIDRDWNSLMHVCKHYREILPVLRNRSLFRAAYTATGHVQRHYDEFVNYDAILLMSYFELQRAGAGRDKSVSRWNGIRNEFINRWFSRVEPYLCL